MRLWHDLDVPPHSSSKSAGGSGAEVHELIFRSVLRCLFQGVGDLKLLNRCDFD